MQVNLANQVLRKKAGDYVGRAELERQRAIIDRGGFPFRQKLVGMKLGGKPITDYAPDFWLVSDSRANRVGYRTLKPYLRMVNLQASRRLMRMEGESENASPDRDDDGATTLFARNRAWAESKLSIDPAFFGRLVGQQTPRYFWIGCSDSRVPATEIVDLDPGEMFVHRNIANLAMENDTSFSATLQFAVEVLEVQQSWSLATMAAVAYRRRWAMKPMMP